MNCVNIGPGRKRDRSMTRMPWSFLDRPRERLFGADVRGADDAGPFFALDAHQPVLAAPFPSVIAALVNSGRPVRLAFRDPETGKPSRDLALYREVAERVRDSATDVVLNLTAGMGGDWTPDPTNWAMPGPGTDMVGPDERLAHVKDCLPEICSLDCGTLNFGNDNSIYISTPPILRRMAALTKEWGVKPRPKFGHGVKYAFIAPDGKKRQVFGCYHPSQQNTFTGKLTEKMLDSVIKAASRGF